MPSYRPGVTPTDLPHCLPDFADRGDPRGTAGVRPADPGFAMQDAVLTGVETRTSSPIRITRGADFHSLNTPACFPPARAPAMPAASCRPAWTASGWPRRWLPS